MRKWLAISLGIGLLLIAVVYLRWPRLESTTVLVTRSEVRGDRMVVEYRMPQPFEVGLRHGVRKPRRWPDEAGVHVAGLTDSRPGRAEFFPSKYDPLRGEHYVRIYFLRGPLLIAHAKAHPVYFAEMSAPEGNEVEWLPPREGVRYGDGVGNDIVLLRTSREEEQYIILYAGTDVRRSVE